ncbi:protein GLUTAMINE DUMPER 3 [Fagus crenata]
MAAREPLNMTAPTATSPMAAQQHSPWHSPVPYLFGGLAAMLGLIAFALLILACSYWRLSGFLDGDGTAERDLEAGESEAKPNDTQKHPPVFEEKFLVIMAGEEKPTYLATPMTSRSSSFGDTTCSSCGSETSEKSVEMNETAKQFPVPIPEGEDTEVQSHGHDTSADQTH